MQLWVVALAAVLCGACSTAQTQEQTEFWLEATPDPQIEVEPAELLPDAATEVVVQGLIVSHGPAFNSAADFTLELLQDDGQTLYIHYSMGMGQRIPVERGVLVRLSVWQAKAVSGRASRAMLLESWRPGGLHRERVPVGIIQADGLIPRRQLPKAVQTIQLHDEVCYQTAERVRTACLRSVVHRGFAADVDQALVQSGAPREVWNPGARVEFRDGIDRFDVRFVDNREVLATDCPDQQPHIWYWTAVWIAPPSGTRQELDSLAELPAEGEANAAELAQEPTPATQSKPGSSKRK